MITRKQYMNKEFSFSEYYGQFSSPNVVTAVANYIGVKRLLASIDEHLNDIPLSLWDRAPWFGMQRMVAKANRSTHANTDGMFTSLSDKVCCLKEAARKFIKENSSDPESPQT